MQMSSEQNKGGMATVMYGPDSKLNFALLKAKEWALNKGDENPECCIANYLYPHCKVVAGSEEVSMKRCACYLLANCVQGIKFFKRKRKRV